MSADEVEARAREALAPQVAASLTLTTTLQMAAIQARAAGLDESGWGQVCAAVWGSVAQAWKASEVAYAKKLADNGVPPVRLVDLAREGWKDHLEVCPICQVAAKDGGNPCSVGVAYAKAGRP